MHPVEDQERFNAARELDGNVRKIADALEDRDYAIKELRTRIADMETRHAREIERARSFLKSLVEHEEIVGGSLVQLSTSYKLAKAALAALDGEDK